MGKKANKPNDQAPAADPHKGIQTNMRFIDATLLAKVDKYAKKERHSRNLMLNILVEEAIAAREAKEAEE